MFVIAALAVLTSCQGVSAGSSTPPPVGDLSMGASALNFGSVTAGTTKTLTASATNSGTKSLTISSAAVSTKYFFISSPTLPVTIAAGQTANLSVSFNPNAAGSFSATVGLTSDASDSLVNLSLTGTGLANGQLTLNPTGEAFGSVTVGSKKTQSVTLTNTGATAVDVSQSSISGTGFQISGLTTPLTLNAAQSTTFTVTFAPQTAGTATGSVTITSNGNNPTLVMQVSGTGSAAAAQLTVSPSALGLGNVVVGTSGTASGSLTASGGSVTVTAATTNNSVFSIGGFSLPLTINPGQSVPFTITFSPTTTGNASASLTVASNAQTSTATETLTGTGTPAPVHTVNLSWNASTSSNISGYNLYRAIYQSSCGGYAKINAVLSTSTLYSDNSVVDGRSYCYAATAVNTSNQESAYSNIVTNVQIPAP